MSDAAKKIAVMVTDRQSEALRMSLGLTIEGDAISVFNCGAPIERTDEVNTNIGGLDMMECQLFSVNEMDEGFTTITMQEIPAKLLEYDHIVPY